MDEETTTISKAEFATLRAISTSADAVVFSLDRQYRYTSFNRLHADVMQALYGVAIELGRSLLDYMTVEEDRQKAKLNLDRALAGESVVQESYSGEAFRSRSCFRISHSPIRDDSGATVGVLVFAQDVTERAQAEEERQVRLRTYEHLDAIDRAIQSAPDLDRLMSNVLAATQAVFDCDRAWLLYPCDPDAPSFRVPMEVTRPEYPGAKVLDADVPMSPGEAENLREALESNGPVVFVAGTDRPITTAEQFGVQSQMFICIHPRTGKPWVFGMHQCSHARLWTKDEQRMFQEIGRRMGDALTSSLMLRDLKASEESYRDLVQGIQAAVVVHGADTRILASNPKAQELLGLTDDQLRGKSNLDLDWHFLREDGTDMPHEEFPVSQVVATGQCLHNFVAGLRRPGKSDVWVLNDRPRNGDIGGGRGF